MAEVFKMLALLVSFGYYDDCEDVKGLFPITVSYLDGEKDVIIKRKSRSNKSRIFVFLF